MLIIKLKPILVNAMAIAFMFSGTKAFATLKIYEGAEREEKIKKTKIPQSGRPLSDSLSIALEPTEPVITVQSSASQKLRMALRYLASKLEYKNLQELNALISLASILNSDRKNDLITALLISRVETEPKGKMKRKEGNPETYNHFKQGILPHFQTFSSERVDQHILRFFSPALGEGSSFYTRGNDFGFLSFFGKIVDQNKKLNQLNPVKYKTLLTDLEDQNIQPNLVLHNVNTSSLAGPSSQK